MPFICAPFTRNVQSRLLPAGQCDDRRSHAADGSMRHVFTSMRARTPPALTYIALKRWSASRHADYFEALAAVFSADAGKPMLVIFRCEVLGFDDGQFRQHMPRDMKFIAAATAARAAQAHTVLLEYTYAIGRPQLATTAPLTMRLLCARTACISAHARMPLRCCAQIIPQCPIISSSRCRNAFSYYNALEAQ